MFLNHFPNTPETAGCAFFVNKKHRILFIGVFARGGYLRAIGVAAAIRGFGIGRTLMAFAERMTAKKAPNFFLCVSSFNRPAQAFYRNCGYEKIGKIDGLIRKGASEFIYTKKLR